MHTPIGAQRGGAGRGAAKGAGWAFARGWAYVPLQFTGGWALDILTVLPPVLAIIVAMLTRNVYAALGLALAAALSLAVGRAAAAVIWSTIAPKSPSRPTATPRFRPISAGEGSA